MAKKIPEQDLAENRRGKDCGMTGQKQKMRLPRRMLTHPHLPEARKGVRNGDFSEIAKVGASTSLIVKDKGCAMTNNKNL